MCGIYGVLHPSRDYTGEMASMREFLRHRGPDGEGDERLPTAFFGHLRLSIIDLSETGSQPMWDPERRACITYNGEIYNYRELREECVEAGLRFHSTSDTEVILNQYLLHGRAAFDRLNGIFAFCLFDARNGDYFLVRDPLGVKPLYYARRGEEIFFASELKALARVGILPEEIDREALQAYLQLDFVPAPLAMVKGVRKLREGFALHVPGAGAPRLSRFTSLPEEVEPSQRTFQDDVAEYDRLIHDAVRRQLVADVPVGVFLSGGIDSSTIARVATEVTGSPVDTFSIGFEDPSFDESRYFREVAAAIGSNHHLEILSPGSLLEFLPKVPHVACEPLADGSIFPTFLLCRFTRSHVKVILSGDGADELFGGYPTYRAATSIGLPGRLPSRWGRALARLAHAAMPVNYDNFSFDFKVKKLLDGIHPDPILRNARWLGSFLPEDLPSLLQDYEPRSQEALEEILHEPASAANGAGSLEKLLRTDQRFYLQDGVLAKVDRASMASSLEVRVPFLDREMVAFARSLPADRKIRGRQFKVIMKRYAEGKIPEPVLRRPKKGFGTPLGKWFRSELKDLLGDVLSPERLDRQGIFRGPFVGRLLRDHWSGRRDNRKLLFNLLAFNLWHDSLHDSEPPRFPRP
jgi:asparagine synthase (glutamine-hydrolysing)